MAQQRSLKNFYLFLGLVAVVGGGVLFWKARQGSAPVILPTGAMPIGADSVAPAAYQMGSDTAPVVVDEWSDFECPFCARLAVLTLPDVKRRLVETGLVRWRFNDFPLPGHTSSPGAHLAGACAAEQNQFWAMHDLIYFNQGQWVRGGARGHFNDFARQMALDMGRWGACMNERAPLARIAQSVQRGAALGVGSTPTIFINGRLFRGSSLSFDELRAAIQSAAGQ